MSIDSIKNNFKESRRVLTDFIEDDNNWENMKLAGDIMVDCLKKGGKIISCGNGGSMSDAMHFAEELSGRFREDRKGLAAVSISDPTHITCVGNDYGFDAIFSRYVQAVGKPGDVLLGISTSGNSVNVLKAAEEARRSGIKVIALTGKKGGRLKDHCDVELRIPHDNYSDRIQEMHIQIIHSFIQYIEMEYFK
ncbi:D-sedoheptulose 7-phosphate isomerase [Saccharicrinis fermentans]|uniref:Phosphoheptose isomerase n=1 Tax=Saccharicrinis fermentans DSM 9555 = JCM 21142 TaxID=869213 RepID=W7Y381_9BACT|nr:D-sedoheptulose 7-phosphate isomerase [Saccharicrinis fermentans]GAF02462.1 phosphoheptose isomerase [Saccharicrinis fermentans DSM 9555 = JCM 21142]